MSQINQDELSEEFLDTEAEFTEQPPKKSDPKLSILMLQLTACLILAAAAVCIRFFGGELYGQLREKYISMFEDTTMVQEVMKLASGQTGDTSSLPLTGGGAVDASSDIQSAASDTASDGSSDDISSATSEEPQISSDEAGDPDESPAGTASDGSDSSHTASSAASAERRFNFAGINAVANLAVGNYNSLCMPTTGTVSSEYGYRVNPVTGVYALHSGIDLAADTGTNVVAALGGVVSAVSEDDSYGIHVELQHDGGVKTLYAHLSGTTVKEGQLIKRGDVLGFVGSTGRSTGSHLHFEVHTGGRTINPRFLLPAVYLS